MILLDGKTLSQKILDSIKLKIENNKLELRLDIILVGNDPNSLKYVAMKERRCSEVGINCIVHRLAETIEEKVLIELVENLNSDTRVNGFFIQLPLPSHIDKNKILPLISTKKDVDGLTPHSPFTPAVVRGVVVLLDEYNLLNAEINAVIINDSQLIGQPLSKILSYRGIKVEITNKYTQNIKNLTRGAGLVISATGVKDLITAEYIKPGAIVVDVGGGDVNFESVAPLCSYLTPTIGGIGPMTIACLLQNLVDAS